MTRLDLLIDDGYTMFAADLRLCVQALRAALQPDHMNVALMGNSCPHLHWGIAPRYRNDPFWGRPIWVGAATEQPEIWSALMIPQYAELIAKIRLQLQPAT